MDQTKQSFLVEYNKNKQNNIMTECINVYRAMQSIAQSLLSCGVRLFVTLMYRYGHTYYQTSSLSGGPIILVFQKGNACQTVKFRRGHPQQGCQIEVGYQKFAIFNQYFRNTDSKYRGISKYRYRIPNRHEKNTDKNTEYRLQILIPTQL